MVLFGAPFDSTTSFRPGTRFAGQAIRNDSYGLEIYSPYQDHGTDGREPCTTAGIWTWRSEIPGTFWNRSRRRRNRSCPTGKLPFMIGGEHLVTLGAVRAAAEKIPGSSYHPF